LNFSSLHHANTNHATISILAVRIHGLPETFDLPESPRQHCIRQEDGSRVCEMKTAAPGGTVAARSPAGIDPAPFLASGFRIPSDNPRIRQAARAVDGFTALGVRDSGKSECQGMPRRKDPSISSTSPLFLHRFSTV
jgi:hypothetical protein